MSKYPTERALLNLIEDLQEDLSKVEIGDPACIPIQARLNLARKVLAAHRKAIKECEDKAR